MCHSPAMVEVGAAVEMQQEDVKRLLPCRAEGQQCQQWLQPEPEPLEVVESRDMLDLWPFS